MSCENLKDPGLPDPSTPRSEDKRVERAALDYLLEAHPDRLTIAELALALNAGGAEFELEDAVERAVCELVGAGLLHRGDGFVLPTRAALYHRRLAA